MRHKEKGRSRPIHCGNCVHYYVTWDPNFPRGCKAHGFKTYELPSITVLKSSGMPCLLYEEKQKIKK